jgi:aldehyde dehydrogenase (NAD+)
VRGKLLHKLANLIEEHIDEFTALEALDVGMFDIKPFFSIVDIRWTVIGKVWMRAKYVDVTGVIGSLRYYAGWADKVQGKTIEVSVNTWLESIRSTCVIDQ